MSSSGIPERKTFPPPFTRYQLDSSFDEMFDGAGVCRASYWALHERLLELSPEELKRRQQSADLSFLHQGITFTVYGREEGTERIFPYDLIPRIISSSEWDVLEQPHSSSAPQALVTIVAPARQAGGVPGTRTLRAGVPRRRFAATRACSFRFL